MKEVWFFTTMMARYHLNVGWGKRGPWLIYWKVILISFWLINQHSLLFYKGNLWKKTFYILYQVLLFKLPIVNIDTHTHASIHVTKIIPYETPRRFRTRSMMLYHNSPLPFPIFVLGKSHFKYIWYNLYLCIIIFNININSAYKMFYILNVYIYL